MGAISQTNVNFVGSHCGISIGEDGPSQMGLEDIALFRSIPGKIINILIKYTTNGDEFSFFKMCNSSVQ